MGSFMPIIPDHHIFQTWTKSGLMMWVGLCGVQGVSEEELACVCDKRFRLVGEYLFPFHKIFVSWS